MGLRFPASRPRTGIMQRRDASTAPAIDAGGKGSALVKLSLGCNYFVGIQSRFPDTPESAISHACTK